MSSTADFQEDLKGSLATMEELAGCAILIEEQKNFEYEAKEALGKVGGFLCVIEAQSGRNTERKLDRPRMLTTVGLLFFFRPIVGEHASPAPAAKPSKIIDAVLVHCHRLEVTKRNSFCHQFESVGYSLIPDEDLLIYRVELETTIQL